MFYNKQTVLRSEWEMNEALNSCHCSQKNKEYSDIDCLYRGKFTYLQYLANRGNNWRAPSFPPAFKYSAPWLFYLSTTLQPTQYIIYQNKQQALPNKIPYNYKV